MTTPKDLSRSIRTLRSAEVSEAMTLYLEALRLKRGVDAVALTTDDGRFVAGAGEGVDLEWMGTVGAASPSRHFDWGEHQLYVHELEVNDQWLRLTVAGAPLGDHDALGGICRILAS
jgi:hypothetical protein